MTLSKLIYEKALELKPGERLLFPSQDKKEIHSLRTMIYKERNERKLQNPSFKDGLIFKQKNEGLEIYNKKEINIDELVIITKE